MNDEKWRYAVVITAIVMFGLYEITELTFDRIERLQKNSQVVIEK
ncbi:MAG: hypothetical protein QXN55_00710 [Candidatus Nitrosotenuis sp.]